MQRSFIPAFRFFPDDGVPMMRYAVQAGVEAAVVPAAAAPGEVWPLPACEQRRDEIELAGLDPLVIESIATTDDQKSGGPNAGRDTEAWIQTLANVAQAGFRVVTWNWMLVADWLRTRPRLGGVGGCTALAYRHRDLGRFLTGGSSLPGWGRSVSAVDLRGAVARYRGTSASQLWDALGAFVERVAPVAQELGVSLAIHPDDPPYPEVLGLPRIITGESALQRVLDLCDLPAHGLCFCSGSLGVNPDNDLPAIVRRFAGRIHFAHLRDLVRDGPQDFHEVATGDGDLPLPELMRALIESGFTGPVRPDHGRNVFGENSPRPGYGLYDRALGLRYLMGLHDGIAARPMPARPSDSSLSSGSVA